MLQPFESLPLHDATLRSLKVQWEEKTCCLYLLISAVTGKTAAPYLLEFQGMTALTMNHQESWGPSSSILSAGTTDGTYVLEMQSGDAIRITADTYRFSEQLWIELPL